MRRTKVTNRLTTMASAIALTAFMGALAAPASADEAAAKKWIDEEFQPSTLTKDEQMKEMQWFINAAKPFTNLEISIVSETIATHEYESKVLAKAFTEITGIKVKHDVIQEGDVVEKIQTQMQSGKNVYDGWINDSDFIGTHFRYGQAVDFDGMDGRRGQGRHRSAARRQRLHRQVVHHGAERSSLPVARPAVRQPLLVPLRLVLQSRIQDQVLGQVRLRPRRSRELVGL